MTRPLEIPESIVAAMVDHARREAPVESCGLLGGTKPTVTSFHPMRNRLASETRYDADPRDLIAAVQALRADGAEILALYHSHPRWEATPSRTDLKQNHYGDVPRIIVSLLTDPADVRVWRLDPDSFEPIPWTVVPRLNRDGAPTRIPDLPERQPERGARIAMQRTLVIFKPDCVQRRLVGPILARFEAKGLRVAALKLLQVDKALGEKHYAEHASRPFFPGLIEFITGGPVVVGVLEGNEAIAVVRSLLGATNGVAAAPGTVRGDFSISKQNNLVHGSDSEESATREIALWFKPEEVISYEVAGEQWVFAGA